MSGSRWTPWRIAAVVLLAKASREAAAFSPDGGRLFSGAHNDPVRIWTLRPAEK